MNKHLKTFLVFIISSLFMVGIAFLTDGYGVNEAVTGLSIMFIPPVILTILFATKDQVTLDENDLEQMKNIMKTRTQEDIDYFFKTNRLEQIIPRFGRYEVVAIDKNATKVSGCNVLTFLVVLFAVVFGFVVIIVFKSKCDNFIRY